MQKKNITAWTDSCLCNSAARMPCRISVGCLRTWKPFELWMGSPHHSEGNWPCTTASKQSPEWLGGCHPGSCNSTEWGNHEQLNQIFLWYEDPTLVNIRKTIQGLEAQELQQCFARYPCKAMQTGLAFRLAKSEIDNVSPTVCVNCTWCWFFTQDELRRSLASLWDYACSGVWNAHGLQDGNQWCLHSWIIRNMFRSNINGF